MRKAKVLLLTNACTVGGAEMHLLSLAKHLSKKKYEVTLAYLKEKPDEARSLKEDFEKAGVRTVDLKLKRKFSPLLILKIIWLIKKYKPDIIHTHLFQAELFTRIAMVFIKTPIFITTYHSMEEFLTKLFWALVARWNINKADQVIVISDAVRDYLVRHTGIREVDKIKRIYYGLDKGRNETAVDIRVKYGIGENDPIIGMVARYAPQKGHVYLLEAMTKVFEVVPNAKLYLAGHDEKKIKELLEGRAKDLGIEKKVIFGDFHPNVLLLMKQFDIFTLSSLWEGFGLVLLEAMSVRKPIVATNVGPIPEVVIDGETGYLVPPKNAELLAEKIIYLLRHKKEAHEMGRAGRKRLEEYFTMKKMIEETEAVYDYWISKKCELD